jgi:hypothetical protein
MKITSLIILLSVSYITSELRFVFETFRHGARAPFLNGNVDMFGETWSGDSELTPIGMRMHYLLGIRNRQVYGKFLNDTYSPSEIYVMSTDTNRTIMSGYAQLQGLYSNQTAGPTVPEERNQVARPPVDIPDLPKVLQDLGTFALPNGTQVVPIHIIPTDSRRFYLYDYRYCKPLKARIDENEKKQSIQDHVKYFKTTYADKLVNQLDGVTDAAWFDKFANLWALSDTFASGHTEGKEFAVLNKLGINQTVFFNDCNKTLELDLFDLQFDDEDFFDGHFSMSPLHQDILNWMATRIGNDNSGKGYVTYSAPKLVMLSGHDTVLMAMQAYMYRVFPAAFQKNFIYPNYAASFYYELHTKDGSTTHEEKDYEILVKMNDINIGKIDYVDFKKNVTELSVNQDFINDFCGFNVTEGSSSGSLLFLTIVLACFTLVLLIVVIVMCVRKRNTVYSNTPGYKSIV